MSNLQNLGADIFFGDIRKAQRNLDALAKSGYQTVYFDGDFTGVSFEQLKEVKRMIDDTPLAPFSLHNLWLFPEPDKNPEDILSVQEMIFDRANILGVKCLTGHFGWCQGLAGEEHFDFCNFLAGYGVSRQEYRKRNIEILKILCRMAKKRGLFLTVENVVPEYLADLGTEVSGLLAIIKEVGEPNLGICLDSGHAFISGLNLRQEILRCGKHLFETHFHDNIGRVSDSNSINDLHQPCGIGRINWLEVIDGLKKINFDNPVVFEIGCEENVLKINKSNWEKFLELYDGKFSNWTFE